MKKSYYGYKCSCGYDARRAEERDLHLQISGGLPVKSNNTNMKRHELKSWPEHFAGVLNGTKTFEARKNDRDYQVGDVLVLKEWQWKEVHWDGEFTGREIEVEVTHILTGSEANRIFGVQEGFCVMSIKPVQTAEREKPSTVTPSVGRLDQAKRFAVMHFDHWNEITHIPVPHTSHYYEIVSLIEDAAEFGFGVAHGQSWKTIIKRTKS